MKIIQPLSKMAAAAALACSLSLSAQTIKTWTGANGDFFDPTRWDAGIPIATEIAVINNGSTATIGATAGARALGSIRLGSNPDGSAGTTESAHIVMNGGTLTIGGTAGDPKVVIGASGTLSTFIQNGGTILFDGPSDFPGSTSDDGLNGLDWEVGEIGLGRFEMHSNAVFRAGDDLKVAENAAGKGSVLIDGNARLSVGSGISISSGGTNQQTMVIGGNAVVDAGNSMGAGNPLGSTDEGYLTMAIGNGNGHLTIQDNAILNIRRLSAREGTSTIIVKNRGQFHIFNVLTGAGTNAASRPPEVGPGGDNNNSSYGSANTSDATLILQEDAQMTVNSAPEAGAVKGLGISAPRGAADPGGKAVLRIQDRALFRLEQDLSLGTGTDAETSDGTLEVVGPNASVTVVGNLNMAVDLEGNVAATDDGGSPAPGKSTLSAVITGTNHTTVNVNGIARIGQGRLKVTLNGFTPVEGQTYTLIKGGTINGTFASADYSAAALAQGLSWQVEYAADAVRLRVTAQPGLPGAPEDNGLLPKTETIFVNTPDTVNNNSTESLGVAIADNGNVMVGWEDDHDDDTSLQYIAAAWTLYNSAGSPITPETEQTSLAVGGSTTTRFLSYFRTNGAAIPPFTSWGPKIKANLFGDGLGMGATSYALGLEVPEFSAIQNDANGENAGDFPSAQLLTSTGSPVRIVSGVPDAYAERGGDIRIGDWDFLGNGNVVVVGESRQADDLASIYGGPNPGTHAIYRILGPNGNEVKAVSLASSSAEGNSEMWHGAGVTRNGFALRFAFGGRATIRLFNNDGSPASTNIDLATLTGHAITATGGRGDGVGFHGNGNDAYAAASVGNDDRGTNAVWVTVLNANGTVRYSKAVSDDVAMTGAGRADAAIDERGRVLAAWDAQVPLEDGTLVRLVMGRLLDRDGNPLGGSFYVSEKELPAAATLEARRPRAAWRGNLAAITWESLNAGVTERVVALRLYSTFTPGSVESVNLTRVVADKAVIVQTDNSLANWEPYASVLGTNVFLIEANTFAQDTTDKQRYVVMAQNINGSVQNLLGGFYGDTGAVYTGEINLSRQNGNPGRVAGDKRPGAVNFILGGEASPHAYPEFTSDNRWNVNEIYTADNRYAVVQTFALTPVTNGFAPLSKVIDPVNGQATAAFSGNPGEVSRFGGDLAALDNGNFVVVIDDRSNMIAPRRTATAAIVTPAGQIVKSGFAVDGAVENQIWSNVAAYRGGFAVRFNGSIFFYDNAGTLRGQVDQNAAGEGFDRGRGDGTRIAAHINSPFVFLAGGTTAVAGRNTEVKVAAFDSRDFTFAGKALVSEPSFPAGTTGYDRVNVAADALDRLVVAYESIPTGFNKPQTVTRILGYNGATDSFTPLTSSFYPFANSVPGTTATPSEVRAYRPTVAMTTTHILVAAKGEINLQNQPAQGPNSPTELNFYTVFTHPNPQADPTPAAGGGAALTVAVAKAGTSSIRLTWTGGTGPFVVQKKLTLADATWTNVGTTPDRTMTLPNDGTTGFFRVSGAP